MKLSWLGTTVGHVLVLAILCFILISFGTFGYIALEGFTFLDALYMTIITLTTVGFGEIRPLHDQGRIFTILLILMGVGFVAYNLAYFVRILIDGDLLQMYRRRKLSKKVSQLKNHYIICGYGQMGQIIVQQLLDHSVPLIVLEVAESALARLREKGVLYIEGDATEEEFLLAAGIHQARGLVSVVKQDTDNVFIVLTARGMNKNLFICARASSQGTERKLLKAGADRVVSPYASGAVRIAHNILRPTVTDFMELALSGEGMELSMEEFSIPPDSELVGKRLMDSGIRHDYNLIIVAIKRVDGKMIYNPAPAEALAVGDILVAIGPRDNLEQFALKLYGRRCPVHTHCSILPSSPVHDD